MNGRVVAARVFASGLGLLRKNPPSTAAGRGRRARFRAREGSGVQNRKYFCAIGSDVAGSQVSN
jgi:hypothetical protein